VRPADLAERPLELPLLCHWGRSDSTVAFYGANIGPADLEQVAFSLPELAGRIDSFALVPWEDEHADKRLRVAFELAEGADAPDADALRSLVLERLRAALRRGRRVGGSGEMSSVSPGRAARPEDGVLSRAHATRPSYTDTPCVLASERPSHPGNEQHSASPS
jgi:hypothetical protein